jgi:TolA-binding protein
MSPRNLRGNTQEISSDDIHSLKDFIASEKIDKMSRKKFKLACEAQLSGKSAKAKQLYQQLLNTYPNNSIIQENLNLI